MGAKKRKASKRNEVNVGASDELLVQLATRVPKELHRELKLHAVKSGRSVASVVAEAITEKLKKA